MTGDPHATPARRAEIEGLARDFLAGEPDRDYSHWPEHVLALAADLAAALAREQRLVGARETIRVRALEAHPPDEGRTSFAEGFFDGMIEAVRIIDRALASAGEPAETAAAPDEAAAT